MLIDSETLKQAILTTMPERSEVLLIVDNQLEGIVRCKDCAYRGNPKKCILAKYISILPDRGLVDLINTSEWFCADGKRKVGDGK